MKKVLLTLAALAITFAAVVTVVSATSHESSIGNALLSSRVEALTDGEGWLEEWWNSEVYKCTKYPCSEEIGSTTYWGEYEACEKGDSVAHCWECADCNAGPGRP